MIFNILNQTYEFNLSCLNELSRCLGSQMFTLPFTGWFVYVWQRKKKHVALNSWGLLLPSFLKVLLICN